MPLNREASNFGSTVLEGFYELSKTVEISMRHPAKDYVCETATFETLGRLWNHVTKKHD